MRLAILVFFLTVSIAGCDNRKISSTIDSAALNATGAATASTDKKEGAAGEIAIKLDSRDGSKGSFPKIIIKNSTITINQKNVWMGGKLAEWKSALGGTPRCIENKASHTICVWDDFGIQVGTDFHQQDRAKFFNINLAPTEQIEGFPRPDDAATKTFSGYLELDGFPITAATEFRWIRGKADAKRDLRCGGSSCINPIGGFSDGASLHMQLTTSSDHGKLVEVSLSCLSTKDCVDLIPK